MPLTDEEERLARRAAFLIYRAMRLRIRRQRALTAAMMTDEILRQHQRMFVPSLLTPVQLRVTERLRTVAERGVAGEPLAPEVGEHETDTGDEPPDIA